MEEKRLAYPASRRENVADNYHGTRVEDPYRWLEDDRSAETAAWVAAQNEQTAEYLSELPFREKIRERLTQLWDYPKDGIPRKEGGWYYFAKNDGLQNQAVIYRSRGIVWSAGVAGGTRFSGSDGVVNAGGSEGCADGTGTASWDDAEVFLDPNVLSENGTVALNGLSFSEDGRHCAYSVSGSGSDWAEIRIVETEGNRLLADRIRWVKFSIPSWSADGKGFYYSAYDAPDEVSEYSAQNRFHKVFYHRLGDAQHDDALIYSDPEHPLRYFHGSESRDGKHVFIHASEGTHGAEILCRPTVGGDFKVLFRGFENDYEIVHADDGRALFLTNRNASNFKLIAVDLAKPDGAPADVIPERDDAPLESVTAVGGYLMATYLEDAASAVFQFDMQGRLVRKVRLGGVSAVPEWDAAGLEVVPASCAVMATAAGFEGGVDASETYYSVATYLAPPAIYRYDLATGASTLVSRPEVDFDASQYLTEQLSFESRDGTRVPMFVTRRKDMPSDGRNLTVMYGYGGFNISHTPAFNPAVIMLLERGGVFVDVTLRGGGEYGERWHRAGMLDRKQNVFDDFIAAAEFLIARGYTSKDKLAVMGGSNGGLLVGACMTQRPDLFAVAIPQVGVLDMLRYHRFTIGWGWAVEYGSADDPGQFEYLYKYSPLHNVRKGACYPATLITTAEHDDRVVPAHSFKFAAALQWAQGCGRPVLIRVESEAGHGAGKPTSKRIAEQADVYGFIFRNCLKI